MHCIATSEKDTDSDALEKRLWDAADQFRANSGLKRQEHSGSAIGLIFLRFTERVRRRLPGVTERIVLITESGELTLSAADQAASRAVTISHADVRTVGRPPGDYLRVLPKIGLPPGHPPVAR